MTDPVFDRNGWCNDMEHPEAREADQLILWVKMHHSNIPEMTRGWWDVDESRWWTGLCEPCGHPPDVIAWRPLTTLPEGET
jgi:hypothetical protein